MKAAEIRWGETHRMGSGIRIQDGAVWEGTNSNHPTLLWNESVARKCVPLRHPTEAEMAMLVGWKNRGKTAAWAVVRMDPRPGGEVRSRVVSGSPLTGDGPFEVLIPTREIVAHEDDFQVAWDQTVTRRAWEAARKSASDRLEARKREVAEQVGLVMMPDAGYGGGKYLVKPGDRLLVETVLALSAEDAARVRALYRALDEEG